jgi:hypothetical protein
MKQLTRNNLAKIYLRLVNENGLVRASKLFAELVQSLGQRREIDLILKDIELELFKQNKRLEVDVYSPLIAGPTPKYEVVCGHGLWISNSMKLFKNN